MSVFFSILNVFISIFLFFLLSLTPLVNDCSHVLGYNSSAYVARTNTELQKLGGSGITVLVSAGDNGAPGRSNNGHCPLDPAAYCTLGGCDHSSSACDSVELSVTKAGQEIECILPLGAGGYGCMVQKRVAVVLQL